MADATHIEWTDATWNIVTGCSVVSPGCTNCYAMRLAGTRVQHHPSRAGLTVDSKAGPVWTGETRFNAEWLTQPLHWKRPRMIFVAAHGDLFHNGVTDDQRDQIFAVMGLAHWHTFQVLTKRPERMRAYFAETWQVPAQPARRIYDINIPATPAYVEDRWAQINLAVDGIIQGDKLFDQDRFWGPDDNLIGRPEWPRRPLPNVWLGVSVEDQTRADERIPILLDTPAAIRWISAEPLLGAVTMRGVSEDRQRQWDYLTGQTGVMHPVDGPDFDDGPHLDWVVAGGESGPGARPMHPDWARQLRDQCADADVPFLFKQWGAWAAIGQQTGESPGSTSRQWLPASGAGGPRAADGGVAMYRLGKKAAGRHLDGVLHDGFPAVRS